MAPPITKVVGLVKAIEVGTTPPLNTKLIWFDDNTGEKVHKYYNINTSSWTPIPGGYSGPQTFLDLSDTPNSYTTTTHGIFRVAAGGTSVEEVDSRTIFVNLTSNQIVGGDKVFSNKVKGVSGYSGVDNGSGYETVLNILSTSTTANTALTISAGSNEVYFGDGSSEYFKTLSGGVIELSSNSQKLEIRTSPSGNAVSDYSGISDDRIYTWPDKSGTIALVSDITANNELSEILVNGNASGGRDISMSEGDSIAFNNSGFTGSIQEGAFSADRTYTLPNKSGTIALVSDIVTSTAFILGNGNINPLSPGGTGFVRAAGSHPNSIGFNSITPDRNDYTFFSNVEIRDGILSFKSTGPGFYANVTYASLTNTRTYTFPDKDGVVAMISDIQSSDELSEILTNGNTTGVNDIIVDDGQKISFQSTPDTESLTLIENTPTLFRIAAVDNGFSNHTAISHNNTGRIDIYDQYISLSDDNSGFSSDWIELGGGLIYGQSTSGTVQLYAGSYLETVGDNGGLYTRVPADGTHHGIFILAGNEVNIPSLANDQNPLYIATKFSRFISSVADTIYNSAIIGGRNHILTGPVADTVIVGGQNNSISHSNVVSLSGTNLSNSSTFSSNYSLTENLEIQGGIINHTINTTRLRRIGSAGIHEFVFDNGLGGGATSWGIATRGDGWQDTSWFTTPGAWIELRDSNWIGGGGGAAALFGMGDDYFEISESYSAWNVNGGILFQAFPQAAGGSSLFGSNPPTTHVSSYQSTTNAGIVRSVILGGANLVANKNNYTFVQNLEIQGGIAQYTVDPTTLGAWGPRSLADKAYVDISTAKLTFIAKTTSYSAVANNFVGMTTGATDKTVTLPSTPTKDTIIAVSKEDSGAGNVIIDGNGETINGSPTQPISTQYNVLIFHYTGSEWRIRL